MSTLVYVLLNLSVFIAGIIALWRYRIISSVYYPFLYCLWIGALNEALSLVLIVNKHQTLVNNNVYVLAEAVLLLWLFKNLGVFKKKHWFHTSLGFLILVWLVESFLIRSITELSIYFRVTYSLLIVFISISTINKLIFSGKKNVVKNATFLLCGCFIVYFTFKALTQALVIYGITRKSNFLLNVYIILFYVNLVVNLLYVLAVLWMPKKAKSILPYSLQPL